MVSHLDKPAVFRASYSDWKLIRTRKCLQIVFEVPIEESNLAYEVLGGMPNPAAECWCAIARLHPETLLQQEQLGPGPKATSQDGGTAPRPPNNKKLMQRAGILANDSLFWCYLEELNPGTAEIMEDEAAEYIRDYCQVTSRTNIVPGTPAAELFSELLTKFTNWKLVPVEAAAE